MSSQLTVAGIPVASTPIIHKAIAYLKANCSELTVNHCMRSWALSTVIASFTPDESFDAEVHAISILLHDLSWDVAGHPEFTTKDKRFEVDGADAAREFLRIHASEWDQVRVDKVWYTIALHATPSIALHAPSIEIGLSLKGIFTDLLGPGFGHIPQPLWDAISAAHPRTGLNAGLKSFFCSLCELKPEGTYDNGVGEYGKFVEGYKGQQSFLAVMETVVD